MTVNIIESIKKMMGWCPNASSLAAKRVMVALPIDEEFAQGEKGKSIQNYKLIALVLLICGMAFAGWGPIMMTWFGVGHIPKPVEGDPFWVGSAFARLFGILLVVLGFVVWSVRDIPDPTTQKIISRALLLGSCFALLISLIQQIEIWNTPAGWVIVSIFASITFIFAKQFTKH